MRGPEGVTVEIDKPQEACGLVAVRIREESEWGPVAHELAFVGIEQLGHRGKATTGIVVRYPDGYPNARRFMTIGGEGDAKSALGGNLLLGQESFLAMSQGRYATSNMDSKSRVMDAIQPMGGTSRLGQIAQGHNGDIANAQELTELLGYDKNELVSDSHLALELFIDSIDNDDLDPVGAMSHVSHLMVGAYSMTTMIEDRLFAWRDPWGFRPLYVAELPDGAGWAVASEQPALQAMGCDNFRPVPRGTAIEITEDGLITHKLFTDEELSVIPESFCSFEFVYFSRPDSEHLGRSVEHSRVAAGEILAHEVAISEVPVKIDIVVGSPDSGMSAAEGYSHASGKRMVRGLIKNPMSAVRAYMATHGRHGQASTKLNANVPVVAGQKLGVVDDSKVRGDTGRAVNDMLRKAGAVEIHEFIASPPYVDTCDFGMDTKRPDELVARGRTTEQIAEYTHADTTHYISEGGFRRALTAEVAGRVCTKCTTGIDPTATPEQIAPRQEYLEKYLANRAD